MRWSTWSLAWLCCAASVHAGDWPQILGPNRNGLAKDESLPALGTRERETPAWTVDCGSGFAGVAVSEGTVVLFHRQGEQETLSAFHATTGAPLWNRRFPCRYVPQYVDDDGPRAVPTIQGNRLYAFGVQGRLVCVDLANGDAIWSRETHQEFSAPEGYFGAGSAPLVEGRAVIVNVGGPKGAGVVAFDSETGKPLWRATDELASYSAPIAVTIAEQRRVLVLTRLNFLGLDPSDGRETFRVPFGARGPTVNGALPVYHQGAVLLTASYGIGAKWLALQPDSAQSVWEDPLLSSQYTTPIVHNGLVYGIDGRQDGGPISLKCFDPATRKVHWTKAGLDYATLVATADALLVMQTNGVLRVVELTPTAYRERGLVRLLSGTTRALPALARGRWYVRNERTLACFDFRGASE